MKIEQEVTHSTIQLLEEEKNLFLPEEFQKNNNNNNNNNNSNNNRENFSRLWAKSTKQLEFLQRLIHLYCQSLFKKLQGINEIPSTDISKRIVELCEVFHPLQRFLFSNSHIQKQLRASQVFLCHAGKKQNNQNLHFLYSELRNRGVDVFLDEKSILVGDTAIDHILYAATTSPIVIILLDRDLLMNNNSLLQLSLFTGRLNRRNKLLRLPLNAHLTDEELIDLPFTILPLFYSSQEKENWIETIRHLSDPLLHCIPKEICDEYLLNIYQPNNHTIIQDVINLLKEKPLKSSPSIATPSKDDPLQIYLELYSKFKQHQNITLSLLNSKRKEGEMAAEWIMGSMYREYQPHYRTYSALDNAMQELRNAGRNLLSFTLIQSKLIFNHREYFLQQGFCELNNVFLFTAPLDALNYLSMHSLSLSLQLSCWGSVLAINEMANDVHCLFLQQFKVNQQENSFDEMNMNVILSDVARYVHRSPPALTIHTKKLLSYFMRQ